MTKTISAKIKEKRALRKVEQHLEKITQIVRDNPIIVTDTVSKLRGHVEKVRDASHESVVRELKRDGMTDKEIERIYS